MEVSAMAEIVHKGDTVELKMSRAEWEQSGRKANWIEGDRLVPAEKPAQGLADQFASLGWTLSKMAGAAEAAEAGEPTWTCRACGTYGPKSDFTESGVVKCHACGAGSWAIDKG